MSGKELGTFNDKIKGKSNDGSSSDDFTKMQANRQKFLTSEMEVQLDIYYDSTSSNAKKIKAAATLYSLIGKEVDKQNESSKQEFAEALCKALEPEQLDDMLTKVLNPFSRRKWLKDSVESHLDECAKKYGVEMVVTLENFQQFINKAKEDPSKYWIVKAAYRQIQREEAESSQRN